MHNDHTTEVLTPNVTRRRFLGLVGVGGAGGLLGACTNGTVPSDSSAAGVAAASTAPTPRTVTLDELSRHPTQMPDSANYTRYEDGRWSAPVNRDGPITITARFTIREGIAEVLPGTTMTTWTFDGTVPGPMVRGRVGDTLDFILDNPGDSSMPHNVDFHAVTGPGGGSMRLDAAPGASSRLKAKLVSPGIYVYHCAFPDIPTHISHGMYGLIVVEPKGGLRPVDHEFYLMQSEFYTAAGGSKSVAQLDDAGHLEFAGDLANLEQPTFVVFNGRPNAITGDRALGVFGNATIETGHTARLYVGNIGPNLISSFHVIGEIFDTVYIDGSFGLANHNVQTTLVPSGGAVGLELRFDVPGEYIIVDHSIFRTHKGALGVIQVQGKERPDLYQSLGYSSELRNG